MITSFELTFVTHGALIIPFAWGMIGRLDGHIKFLGFIGLLDELAYFMGWVSPWFLCVFGFSFCNGCCPFVPTTNPKNLPPFSFLSPQSVLQLLFCSKCKLHWCTHFCTFAYYLFAFHFMLLDPYLYVGGLYSVVLDLSIVLVSYNFTIWKFWRLVQNLKVLHGFLAYIWKDFPAWKMCLSMLETKSFFFCKAFSFKSSYGYCQNLHGNIFV